MTRRDKDCLVTMMFGAQVSHVGQVCHGGGTINQSGWNNEEGLFSSFVFI